MSTAPRNLPALIDVILAGSSISEKTQAVTHRLAAEPHKVTALARFHNIRNAAFVDIVAANGQRVTEPVPAELMRFYASDVQVHRYHPRKVNAKKEPMVDADGKALYDESRWISRLVIIVPVEDDRFDALTSEPSGDTKADAPAEMEIGDIGDIGAI